jgi:NitT/TauT family transport system ATP-binding protein
LLDSPAIIARARIAGDVERLARLTRIGARRLRGILDPARWSIELARILAADPEVLLMGEPFAALDAMTRQEMQEELLRIQETSRKTVLFITHSIDEALILAGRIVVMSARPGRVKTILDNTLPRPRHVSIQLSHHHAALKAEVWGLVEGKLHSHTGG